MQLVIELIEPEINPQARQIRFEISLHDLAQELQTLRPDLGATEEKIAVWLGFPEVQLTLGKGLMDIILGICELTARRMANHERVTKSRQGPPPDRTG